MNKIIQTSLLIYCTDTPSGKVALPIKDNNFIREMKANQHIHHLLFVCSNPTNHSKTDSYAKITLESFLLSGFKVDKMSVLDSRLDKNMASLIKDSDVIFLAGGDTPTQMKYFDSILLKDELHKYTDKVIIGQSAGAMNLANIVYNSPEVEDMATVATTYYNGLGFTDVNIEPHFDITNRDYIVKILLPDSLNRPFIALLNDSIIVKDTYGTRLYGEAYAFYSGKVKKICDSNTLRKLPENISELYSSLD